MKYLPSIEKISQEIIATGLALVFVSWLVSEIPALRKLVKDYQI